MADDAPGEKADARGSAVPSQGSRIEPEATTTDLALKALRERPKFSITMQVYLAVLISFVLFIGIGSSLLITTRLIENKVRFLEISNSYLFEIQQARRFEKNFFLYGTNLEDAIRNADAAHKVLVENAAALEEIIGKTDYSIILSELERYGQWLGRLEEIERNPEAEGYLAKKKRAEVELRNHGQETVARAQDLMQREQIALDKMIALSRKVHIYAFVFLFLFFSFNTYFLGRRVLRPLKRFVSYAQRIATGDYSPIMPARRYRDEFSDLAVAINEMVKEIETKQDQLIQSHKVAAIGLLTSGVAHELNNPINNINITAEFILENYDLLTNEEKKNLLKDIMQQGERASSTVGQLLHFARAKADGLEEIRVTDLIDDTLRILHNQLKLNRIVLEKEYPQSVPLVRGNRNNLQQVFMNLFLNAIQAMPEGGVLRTVVSDTHVGLVKIDVTDTGVGIKPEDLQRIFDPFFTTKEVGKGTGLGLAVSFGIVKKHGGKITVSSEVGKGSTFSVFLPCLEQERPDSTGEAPVRDEETVAARIE